MQAEFFRALQQRAAACRSRPAIVDDALVMLDDVIARVAARHEGRARARDRSRLGDEIADIARDLRVWVRSCRPRATGSPSTSSSRSACQTLEGRDPRSRPDPVLVDGRFQLRGSVDLIEQKRDGALLRVTDHKTGRNRTTWKTVIGGGIVLQPVLYSLAVENGARRAGRVGPSVLLHVRRRLHRARDPDQRANRRAGTRGARDHRSRHRARLPAGGAPGARLHLVRLPAGLRTGRSAPRADASRRTSSPISRR